MFEVFKKFILENKGKYGASVVVIFSSSGKVLLLKRASDDDWMPNKWAFVGGKIEKNETEEEGAVREVQEETGIKLNKNDLEFLYKEKNVYYFMAQLDNRQNVKLDKDESSSFKWCSLEQVKKLECVPKTLENIRKASKRLNKDMREMWR